MEAGLQEVETHIATIVERLQQRELEVLHSEQLAAVGQLAAGLAHELRNPLMPMKMLVTLTMPIDFTPRASIWWSVALTSNGRLNIMRKVRAESSVTSPS
jgi:signal transduction histidine kinase